MQLVGIPRSTRQLKKAFHNFVLTVVCGFTTILVLKGTAGLDGLNPLMAPSSSVLQRRRIINEEKPATASYYSSSIHLRSDLQHAHLLSEVNNLLHLQQSAHPHILLQSAPSPQNDPLPHSPLSHHYHLNPLPNSAFSDHTFNPTLNAQLLNPLHTTNDPSIAVDSVTSTGNPSLSINANRESNPVVNPTVNPNPNQNNVAATEKLSTPSKVTINLSEKIGAQHNVLEVSSKPSILLVTGSQPFACENPMGDHYLMKSLKNKMDYCRLHKIEIFYNMANFDPQMSGFWAKLPLIQRLMLAHPEKEWLWWMDSDAMITDMAFELPMDRYKDYNLVLHGWRELVYEEKNWIGLNTGSFLMRNCMWSLNLLEAWAPMGPKGKVREEAGKLLSHALVGRPPFEADDQSALIYLLNEQKSKWASKVYLENAYYLHGYWMIIVDRYEEMMEKYHSGLGDERWPFVTHFVGCKPCNNKKLVTQEDIKCLEHMERAFNFADNQVLHQYGLEHEALNRHTLIASSSPH